MDGRLTLRARVDGEKAVSRFAPEVNYLPLRGEAARQAIEQYVVDQEREQLLIESIGELYSSPHHFEASQTSDTRNKTASQRVAASSSARIQRCPATMPGSGSLAAPALADRPSL